MLNFSFHVYGRVPEYLQCEEEDAFNLLKHLMFRRKMRANYLPDMKQFQLQLYQLSRLVRDHIPDLYKWLDQNEVSPTLYAAPWILTVFSSQFPLGFVARIFGKSQANHAFVRHRVSLCHTFHGINWFAFRRFTIFGIVGGDIPRRNRIA